MNIAPFTTNRLAHQVPRQRDKLRLAQFIFETMIEDWLIKPVLIQFAPTHSDRGQVNKTLALNSEKDKKKEKI